MVRHGFASLFVVFAALAGCTTEVVTWEEPPESDSPSRPDDETDEGGADGDGDGDRDAEPGPAGGEVTGIPAGQMPPPGECRVWYPDRSPGRQPPPSDCDTLSRSVPEDAWLLYRPTQEARVYRIA